MKNEVLQKKKIALVTGASGFVGSNLVYELLSRGYVVHVVVRPNSNLWRLEKIVSKLNLHLSDIADNEKMVSVVRDVSPTSVFHLVHYGGNGGQNNTREIRRVIIDGTASLYEACVGIDTIQSVVNVGSSSEYGSKNEPMREDMFIEPNTDYGVARAWATLQGQCLARKKILPVVTARLFSAYGPYEHRGRFMTEVILACLRGDTPKLTDPDTARDFIFIDDVVDALINISEYGNLGEVYNVGTGKERTLLEAAKFIAKYTGFKEELKWGTMSGRSFDTDHWRADISHTNNTLGWKAKNDLENGVKKTVDWFKKHLNHYENI